MQNFGNRCAEFLWKFCTPHFSAFSLGKFHTWLCRIFEKTGADFWWKLCTSHFGVIPLGFVHTWLLRSWRGGVQPLDRESAQHVFENFMTFCTRREARTVSGTHGKKGKHQNATIATPLHSQRNFCRTCAVCQNTLCSP